MATMWESVGAGAICRVGLLGSRGAVAICKPRATGIAMLRTDQRKLELWARRVQQQVTSGLSVSKYCQREKLVVHHFYYWRRKLAGSDNQTASAGSRKQAPPPAAPVVREDRASGDVVVAMVQIQLGSRACVSVPGHMLETIRAVIQTALSCGSDDQPQSSASAFHPVILRS